MDRRIFIIIGAVIVLILIAVWVYLLFFSTNNTPGDTNNNEQFADLQLGDTTDTDQAPQTGTEDSGFGGDIGSLVDIFDANEPLRQLTTKKVIGYAEIQRSSTSPKEIYYMESGVGHLFSINLESGEETRVSGTTIPGASQAVISSDGKYVAVQDSQWGSSFTSFGSISHASGSISLSAVDETVFSMKFSEVDPEILMFATQDPRSVSVFTYNFDTDTTRELFTVPYREARIVWGDSPNDTHYVYPKAAGLLQGFLYRVDEGVLTRTNADGYGFTAAGQGGAIIYGAREEGQYNTYLDISDLLVTANISLLPEKCTFGNKDSMLIVCAHDTSHSYQQMLPDTWYQGQTSFVDSLWTYSDTTQSFESLVDVSSISGRDIDIVGPIFNNEDSRLYFLNKKDEVLWLYQMPVREEISETVDNVD